MTHEEGVLVRVLEQLGRDVVEALAPPTFRRRLLQWWRARRRPTVHTYGPHARFVGLTDRELAEWREDLDAQARRHVREVERRLEDSRGSLDVPDGWLEPRQRQTPFGGDA